MLKANMFERLVKRSFKILWTILS